MINLRPPLSFFGHLKIVRSLCVSPNPLLSLRAWNRISGEKMPSLFDLQIVRLVCECWGSFGQISWLRMCAHFPTAGPSSIRNGPSDSSILVPLSLKCFKFEPVLGEGGLEHWLVPPCNDLLCHSVLDILKLKFSSPGFPEKNRLKISIKLSSFSPRKRVALFLRL